MATDLSSVSPLSLLASTPASCHGTIGTVARPAPGALFTFGRATSEAALALQRPAPSSFAGLGAGGAFSFGKITPSTTFSFGSSHQPAAARSTSAPRRNLLVEWSPESHPNYAAASRSQLVVALALAQRRESQLSRLPLELLYVAFTWILPRQRDYSVAVPLHVSLPLPNRPNGIAISDTGDTMFVTSDARALFVLARSRVGELTYVHRRTVNVPYDLRNVAVDHHDNAVVVGDGIHQVVVMREDGAVLSSFGPRGTAPGAFQHPESVAVDPDGNIVVADLGYDRVQVVTREGVPLRTFGVEQGWFRPAAVAVDSKTGSIAAVGAEQVCVYRADGTVSHRYAVRSAGVYPRAAFDDAGNVVMTTGKLGCDGRVRWELTVFHVDGAVLWTCVSQPMPTMTHHFGYPVVVLPGGRIAVADALGRVQLA